MHKIKIVYLAVLVSMLLGISVKGQVSIGSLNPPIIGALLQLKDDNTYTNPEVTANKGLLLPRVKLVRHSSLLPFDVDDNSSYVTKQAHKGLIVYNLTNNRNGYINGVGGATSEEYKYTPGVYTWDGTKWIALKYTKAPVLNLVPTCPSLIISRKDILLGESISYQYSIDYTSSSPGAVIPAFSITDNDVTVSYEKQTLVANGKIQITVNGLPSKVGQYTFTIPLGKTSCTFTLNVVSLSLSCPSAAVANIVKDGQPVNIDTTIPYSGALAGSKILAYTSASVYGLTVSIPETTLSTNGTLNVKITGIPSITGNINIPISLTMKSDYGLTNELKPFFPITCNIAVNVRDVNISPSCPSLSVTRKDLFVGESVNNYQYSITYTSTTPGAVLKAFSTNENGVTVSYPQTTLAASGQITVTVTGTPSAPQMSTFTIPMGSASCEFTLNAIRPTIGCPTTNVSATLGNYISETRYITLSGLPDGTRVDALTTANYNGLQATIQQTTLNGSGSIAVQISGTPTATGSINIPISLTISTPYGLTNAGKPLQSLTCNIGVNLQEPVLFNCPVGTNVARNIYVGERIDYNYAIEPYTSPIPGTQIPAFSASENSVIVSYPVHTLVANNGSLSVSVKGTAASVGNSTFDVVFGTKTCPFTLSVSALPSICPTGKLTTVNQYAQVNETKLVSYSGAIPGTVIEPYSFTHSSGLQITIPRTTLSSASGQYNIQISGSANISGDINIPVDLTIKSPHAISGTKIYCNVNVTINQQPAIYFECPTSDIKLDPNGYTYSTARIVVKSGSVTLRYAQLIGQKDGININYPGSDLTITPSNSPQTITVSITAMSNAIPGSTVNVPLDKVFGVSSQCAFNVTVNEPPAYFLCPTTDIKLSAGAYTSSSVKIVVTSGSATLRHAQLIGQKDGININYTGPDLTITPSNSPQTIPVSISAMSGALENRVINVPLDKVSGVTSQCAFSVTVNGSTSTSAYFDCPTTNITLDPGAYTSSTARLVVTSGSVTLKYAQLIGQKDGININYTGSDLTITPSNSPQTIPVSISAMSGAPEGVVINVPLDKVSGVSSQCTFNVTVNKVVVPPPPLAVDDLPNCYIVPLSAKEFTFPVEKAYLAWERQQHLSLLPKPTGTPSANAVWTNVYDGVLTMKSYQVPDVSVSSTPGFSPRQESITLKLKGNVEGSVIIEYKVGGTVMWSWHIWVTDYKPTGRFFDRNVGAKGDLWDTKNMTNRGFYYQWGRSTPFAAPIGGTDGSAIAGFRVGPVYIAASPKTLYDFSIKYVGEPGVVDQTNSSIKYSVSNHNVFLLVNGNLTEAQGGTEGDWYSTKLGYYDNELWGGGYSSKYSNKGLFDPCPTGWRVPTSTELSYMFPDPSRDFVAGGILTSPNPTGAALPSTGYLDPLSGTLVRNSIEDLIALWTVTKFESVTSNAKNKYVHASNYISHRRSNGGAGPLPVRSPLNYGARGFAMPVRCVQQ